MNLIAGFIIRAIIVCCSIKRAIALKDGCEIASNGEVVCNENCVDDHELCSFWASSGECLANPTYMLENCKKSCDKCEGTIDEGVGAVQEGDTVSDNNNMRDSVNTENLECTDEHELCSFWASKGECLANPTYMLKGCKKSCQNCPGTIDEGVGPSLLKDKELLLESIQIYGVPQTVQDDSELPTIRDTISYMRNFVNAPKPTHRMNKEQISLCINKESLCSYWASKGDCESNSIAMIKSCAPACRSCHKIDTAKVE